MDCDRRVMKVFSVGSDENVALEKVLMGVWLEHFESRRFTAPIAA
jgi:hypothetical protein